MLRWSVDPGVDEAVAALGGMWVIASSAMAVIVSEGLTPTFAGMVEPSVTSRFS